VDGVIHNTKRIHRLSTEKEMIPLAEAVMQTEAILEEWIPKEQLQGENYDLRVVCRESEIDYIVVRCSKGSITNLHLNNTLVERVVFAGSSAATNLLSVSGSGPILGFAVCRSGCPDGERNRYTLYNRSQWTGRSCVSGYVCS
jgi:hypothetical protein